MARKRIVWLRAREPPLTWRIRGKASDGMIVTLGKYDSKKKAEADCERFVKEGYADVSVDPIKPPPAPKDAK